MPLPVSCPKCGHSPCMNNGIASSGSQRAKCPKCGKSFTLNPKKSGPPSILGDRPLTPYERLKRHLNKKKGSS